MNPRRKKRTLLVEDSPVARLLLEEIIQDSSVLELAASVESAEEALRLLPSLKPDVISLDLRLPGMTGMEAMRHIMALQPTPIVVVSEPGNLSGLSSAPNILKAGALAVIEKPQRATGPEYTVFAQRLCRQLDIMSDVPVIRQYRKEKPVPAVLLRGPLPSALATKDYRALGIVASTGGPNAVAQVLRGLGSDFPLPVFLVQHITPSFLEAFAAWLGGISPLPVVIAEDGMAVAPGRVHIAPASRHLHLDGTRLRLIGGPPVSGQCPSGTVLLRSMAVSLGARAIGVVLTGMGDDGSQGLRDIREAGGFTLAEDASTAVIYGMPAAAMAAGAVSEQLPLDRIGARLRDVSLPQPGRNR